LIKLITDLCRKGWIVCIALLSLCAHAQTAANFPNKPIKIIVPFAAGGSTDALARLLAQKLTSSWGQTVIVENKPGAGATLGADYVTKAPADGYTLLMGPHIIRLLKTFIKPCLIISVAIWRQSASWR